MTYLVLEKVSKLIFIF